MLLVVQFYPWFNFYFLLFYIHYTQIKKTVNTENIPGMCVLTNHMRDLVTAENEWVLSPMLLRKYDCLLHTFLACQYFFSGHQI